MKAICNLTLPQRENECAFKSFFNVKCCHTCIQNKMKRKWNKIKYVNVINGDPTTFLLLSKMPFLKKRCSLKSQHNFKCWWDAKYRIHFINNTNTQTHKYLSDMSSSNEQCTYNFAPLHSFGRSAGAMQHAHTFRRPRIPFILCVSGCVYARCWHLQTRSLQLISQSELVELSFAARAPTQECGTIRKSVNQIRYSFLSVSLCSKHFIQIIFGMHSWFTECCHTSNNPWIMDYLSVLKAQNVAK